MELHFVVLGRLPRTSFHKPFTPSLATDTDIGSDISVEGYFSILKESYFQTYSFCFLFPLS